MRSVVRRVQFVNRLMRLESDYSDGQGRKEGRKEGRAEGRDGTLAATREADWSAAGSLASQ